MRYGKRFPYQLMLAVAACGFAINAAILAMRNSPVSFISLGLAATLLLGTRWSFLRSRGGRHGSD